MEQRSDAENRQSANAVRGEQTGGHRVGIWRSLFGCRHKKLSRPFTFDRQSYCVCLSGGARRGFDPQNLVACGAFYYPTEITR